MQLMDEYRSFMANPHIHNCHMYMLLVLVKVKDDPMPYVLRVHVGSSAVEMGACNLHNYVQVPETIMVDAVVEW